MNGIWNCIDNIARKDKKKEKKEKKKGKREKKAIKLKLIHNKRCPFLIYRVTISNN